MNRKMWKTDRDPEQKQRKQETTQKWERIGFSSAMWAKQKANGERERQKETERKKFKKRKEKKNDYSDITGTNKILCALKLE